MMQVSVESFELKLREPFTISRGTVTAQPTLIVRLEHDGLVGLGEATTNAYYGNTLGEMTAAIARVAPLLADYQLENPAELWKELDPELQDCRFAQCALDCATWDLYAQMHSMPLWKLWGFHPEDYRPPSCFTIGIDEPDVMLDKIRAKADWPIFKIKLPEHGGLDLVRTLRAESDAVFRVDANGAWKAERVMELAEQLADLGVELIEQPLAAEEFAAMNQLKGRCAIPLMADESCRTEADVDRCIESFDAINIKLTKCGGLSPARRMITRAKQNGLKVMLGCMTESSVGIGAGVHLLPLLDFADLDGALLLAADIATGLEWERGFCRLTEAAGIGVQISGLHWQL